MTITTAKLPARVHARAGRAAPRLRLLSQSLPLLPGLLALPAHRMACLLSAALMALAAAPARAEWKFTPTVDLAGTYSDNVGLVEDSRKLGRFIAEVTPGFTLVNNSRRVKFNASYQLHYYAFDDDGIEDARHVQQSLLAQLSSVLIDDLLYLDGDAAVGQRAVSTFGPQINYNGYAGANRSNVRSYRISPYLRHSFGTSAIGTLRYTRDSVDAGNRGLGNSDGDSLDFNLSSGPTFRRIGWGLQASVRHISDSVAPNTEIKTVGANLRYRLGDSFALTASTGYDEYDYQSVGAPVKGKNWSGGFDWTPSPRTSLRASVGKRYYGDSYLLEALHRSRRSVWTINYNDAVTTSRDQFLLPATVDTASVLDRLFTADIPDPVARRAAVEAYIRASGLPSALAESVNYFTNRYVLQKQLQLSAAFNMARTTLVVSAFNVKRNALSNFETDGALSGPGRGSLNDDTTQTGASALLNWRLTSRSSANLSLTRSRSESNSTNLETRNTAARLALTRSFSPRMSGTAELRRTSGNTAFGAAGYRENAITASLSLKL